MKEKDKQIARDIAEVTIDAVVSKIPGLDIAWGLSKALLGAGLKLRQQRALEWVEMVRANPGIFSKDILAEEAFQDGFVFALEKYIAERSETKRKHYRKIFLGFTEAENKSEFELEKFFQTLLTLNETDISILGYVDTHSPNSYQLFDDAKYLDSVYNLVNVGIIYVDPSSRMGPIHSPNVYTSDFGRRFIRYLSK